MKRARLEPVRPRVLRTADAAEYIGVSASALERMRVSGGGPLFVPVTDQRVGYDIRDLDAWVDSRPRRGSTSESGR